MEENVPIISNANQEFVTMLQTHAVVEGKETHAMTMLSVIETWLVDQVSFGHMKPNAFLWAM